MKRPNVIEIIWHDLGDWLSCYGYEHITSPSLEAMAKEGVVFDNNFCTAPQCSPSRSSIMTGRYPHSNGMMGLAHRGWEYNEEEIDLPLLLNRAGYHTYLFGLQHEYHDKGNLNYQYVDTSTTSCYEVADLACQFLKEEAKNNQPFFASIGFVDVHRVFGTRYDREIVDKKIVPGYLPDIEIVRKNIATFYRKIRAADAATGRILTGVKQGNIEENTLVFFTTDHGPEFPRAKMTLYDPGVKTALIMKYPGVLESGKRIEELVSNVDLLPTILDVIEISCPSNVQGRSYLPLLKGESYEPREEIYTELTWHALYDPMRSIRAKRYKYIRNFQPGLPILIGGPPAQRYGKEVIEKLYGGPRPEEEVYDLVNDPWEKNNLAGDEQYSGIQENLSSRLMTFLERTDDPILRGPIPHPGRKGYGCYWIMEGRQFKLKVEEDFGEYPV